MPNFEHRPVQTRVKHQIQSRYQRDWGGIITNGLRARINRSPQIAPHFRARFLYFDGFSYKGKYLPDHESSDPFQIGSPLIGVQALDDIVNTANHERGVPSEGIAVLVEQNPTNFSLLRDTLGEMGYGSRLKIAADVQSLKPGEIGLYSGDAINIAPEFLKLANKTNTFTFALLDPWGPTGIPYEFVKSFVNAPNTDVMVYWPWYDLEKKTGMVTKSVVTSSEQGLIDNYDRIFPDNTWQALVELSDPWDNLERELVDEYVRTLREMSRNVFVKLIPLEMQDADRTLYYLFLTTRNPDGALKLNEVLDNAKVSQQALKVYRKAQRESMRSGTAPMFDLAEYDSGLPEITENRRQIDTAELSKDIFSIWSAQSPKFGDIKGSLANTDVYVGDVMTALRGLRRSGLADWEGDSLRNSTIVKFEALANNK